MASKKSASASFPIPLSEYVAQLSRSLGEPQWLLEKRLEAAALLEKRKGKAEVSGRLAKGSMKASFDIKGRAAVLGFKQALLAGNALKEQLGRPFLGMEPDSYLLSFALFSDGIVAAFDSGSQCDVSIELSGKMPEHFATIFLFSDHSEANVLIKRDFSSPGSEFFAVFAGKGSQASICTMQKNSAKADSSLGMVVHLGQDSKLKLISSNLGSKSRNEDILILQNERGSRCEHYEASIADGKRKISKQSDHFHLAPDTFSRSLFKYATAGESQVFVDGKVTIEKSAPGSDTHLLAKSLLLSEKSISHVVPQLFVRNSEVSAGHGSAMTPLEQEELFYLQSRGLGEEEAKLLVLQGFMQEVLNKSELPAWLAQKAEEEIYSCAKGIFGKG